MKTMPDRAAGRSKRPFYLIVTFWGARFRRYFLEYCLPSLLASGNLPAISKGRPIKFLIATLPADWDAIQGTRIFAELKRHAEPVFIDIPPCPPNRSGCQHMGVGHKLMSEIAYRDRSFAVLLTPDLMLSDGTMAQLDRYADSGIEIVLVAALRFGEEPFLGHLKAIGALPDEERSRTGGALAISGRQMVAAAVNGLHSETLTYEWDAPHLPPYPPAAWWRVPNEDGILLHCLSWAPLLLDYSVVKSHDLSALETWTIDGDYVYSNFGQSNAIHVVQDSDEMFVASWSPLDDKAHDLTPSPMYRFHAVGEVTKGAHFRSSYYSRVFDPLKRTIFFLPVRWHSRPLNSRWKPVERRALRKLISYVTPPAAAGFRIVRFADASKSERPVPVLSDVLRAEPPLTLAEMPAQLLAASQLRVVRIVSVARNAAFNAFAAFLAVVALFRRAYLVAAQLWVFRDVVRRRLRQALYGDRRAIERIKWRVRVGWATIVMSRPPLPPEPAPPEDLDPVRDSHRTV
jgi:hypothetical protein